jgi:alpha-mannosidase
MATDETARVDAELESVTVIDRGPVVARVRIRWQLLGVIWNTTVQVWADSARVDIETEVDWPAFENWQIRSPLAVLPRRNVTHGTPFHASGWEDVADGVAPYMPDEISAEDLASYREVQHWLHLRSSSAAAGLAVLTTHPAFRHDGDKLEIVLLRTAPSCGDPRMAWTNPGRTTWAFSLVPVADDWRAADVPELADVHWRRPRVLPTGSDAEIDLLANSGDTVRLSALYADPDGIISARLVNQSDSEKVARLSGAAIETTAELTDLAGNVQGTAEPRDGVLTITVPAWHIQTVRLGTVSQR